MSTYVYMELLMDFAVMLDESESLYDYITSHEIHVQ